MSTFKTTNPVDNCFIDFIVAHLFRFVNQNDVQKIGLITLDWQKLYVNDKSMTSQSCQGTDIDIDIEYIICRIF